MRLLIVCLSGLSVIGYMKAYKIFYLVSNAWLHVLLLTIILFVMPGWLPGALRESGPVTVDQSVLIGTAMITGASLLLNIWQTIPRLH